MRVVLQLTESISGSGRNVTTDNFFTSYQLSKELTKRNLTLVGTVRGNRKEIPQDMLPAADREVKSSVFGFSADGATMVSCVPKRRKAVVLVSTEHREDTVMPDDSRKPEIINYYNNSAGRCVFITYNAQKITTPTPHPTRPDPWTMAAVRALVGSC